MAGSTISVTRGPYLQLGTPTSMTVRWRTNVATDTRVRYGLLGRALDQTAGNAIVSTEHEVQISGLQPGAEYDYVVGTSTLDLVGNDGTHRFRAAPAPGSRAPVTIWALGDSGTADSNAAAVRNGFLTNMAGAWPDVWLMLGDNAYGDGTDSEYEAAVFDMYPTILRRVPLWPTRGNHDDSASAYFGGFSLPAAGQAGGLPSGSEAYYSFEHGDVHFICLDSTGNTNLSVGGTMWTWLAADLAANEREWTIAYWHHPPYSKGSHDSDDESELITMRTNFLPLLEEGGVDLVLGGHSHCYERSYLIDGHYGHSTTFGPSMLVDGGDGSESGSGAYSKAREPHAGAIYCVAGSGGKLSDGDFDHPVMHVSAEIRGSVVIEVDGLRMDVRMVRTTGALLDAFTLLHEGPYCQPDLGYGGPGAMTISLCGEPLDALGNTAFLELGGAPSGALVYLALSTTFAAVPLYNGTLVPFPVEVLVHAGADGNGALAGPIVAPGSQPAQLFLQALAVDGGGEVLFSNALQLELGLP